MAYSSPHLFNILYEAWRHAEQAAIIAERRWIDAIERPAISQKEKSRRRIELDAARETSRTIFKQAMKAATLNKRSTQAELFSNLQLKQSNNL